MRWWLLGILVTGLGVFNCDVNADAKLDKHIRLGIYNGLVNRFPKAQGVMWSDRVFVDVFTDQGYQLSINEYPARRIALTLDNDVIDSYLDTEEPQSPYQKNFIRSELPVSVVTWYIYFDYRKGWHPQWPPNNTLREKVGKSKNSSDTLRKRWGLQVSQSSSFDAIVKMVNLVRVDYWIDDASGIRTLSEGLLKGEKQGFRYQPLYKKALYYYFQNTGKGQRLERVFYRGLRDLYETGRFAHSFVRGDEQLNGSRVVEETLNYIRQYHPLIGIPGH